MMMYSFLIDPDKWVNVGELKLEEERPYWFKKRNGHIVMETPFSNGYSSGIADYYFEDGYFRIKTNTFHMVKGGQVQPVLDE